MAKRTNGEGSVAYDKTRNNYRAIITLPDKKRIQKRFANREDADHWIVTQRAAIYNGCFVAPSAITLGEYAVTWLLRRVQCHKGRWNAISRFLSMF